MATVIQTNSSSSLIANGNGLTQLESYRHNQSDESAAALIMNSSATEELRKNGVPETGQSSAAAGAASSCSSSGTQETDEPEPEIDIMINNVVCSFSVRCHLNLRDIAMKGVNVEYRKENGKITMKLRRPYTTASIWSSGKITCTGATSEVLAKVAARRFARRLQKLGFKTKFNNYRVVNVLGTCYMPFAVRLVAFSQSHREASYEPELHPGVTYRLKSPKATLKIFSTGSVTVTAPRVANVQAAIEYIYPLLYEFRKERTAAEKAHLLQKRCHQRASTFEDPCDTEDISDEDVI